MAKLVKLSLEGNLETGYQVELIQIAEEQRDGKTFVEGIWGTLPTAADIYQSYENWQNNYEQLDLVFRGEWRFFGSTASANISLEQCEEIAKIVKQKINDWLDCPGFRPIADKILTNLDPAEDIRLLIKTTDYKLWQLPWSAWDFFESYPNAEVVFSSFDARYGEKPIKVTPRKNVRILGVFGDARNINTQSDRDQIERLKSVGAEPTLVPEPSVQKLRNLLWDKSWDIFFFAGHGDREKTLNQGKIYLNSEEALTPSEFKNSLKTAIVDRGLKIVFLNSCLGLEFAYQLVTEFGIPMVIAMREPIPDRAAQKFLEYFLVEYADNGRPLYVAVRRAKERIAEEWQTHYPGLDWLPVLCQNPASLPPKWRDLHNQVSLNQAVLVSFACTSLVILLRSLGLLQSLELLSYDFLLRNRPTEKPDDRITIVTIDEGDIQYQQKENLLSIGPNSIGDKALSKFLKKIIIYKPRVIGFDIYRNDPPFSDEVIEEIKNISFVPVCKISSSLDEYNIAPPPNIPENSQVGFTNVPLDPKGFIRRQLVGMKSNDICKTSESFSSRIAFQFLQQEKGGALIEVISRSNLRINNKFFKALQFESGGYQLPPKEAEGFQIILNYRNNPKPFNTVPLREILNGKRDGELSELIHNRIILLGVTLPNEDTHYTPYSRGLYPKKMFGVEVHAHAISNIISSVLDDRPLIGWWDNWIEIIWIGGWGLVGGLLIWNFRSPLFLGLATAIATATVVAICFLLLVEGTWVPLVALGLALILTIVGGLLLRKVRFPLFVRWTQIVLTLVGICFFLLVEGTWVLLVAPGLGLSLTAGSLLMDKKCLFLMSDPRVSNSLPTLRGR